MVELLTRCDASGPSVSPVNSSSKHFSSSGVGAKTKIVVALNRLVPSVLIALGYEAAAVIPVDYPS